MYISLSPFFFFFFLFFSSLHFFLFFNNEQTADINGSSEWTSQDEAAKMNRKGVKWSPEVLGALIKAFCDEGLRTEALVIQNEMARKGVFPNAVVYNTLMDAYCKSNPKLKSNLRKNYFSPCL